ncbi:unnamed protein product [Closterium sp. NIES-53]
MIHAAAPHFLWPFAVRYAAHQLNLWPRVSLPETSPTLRWMGKVGDASVFWVRGTRAFVRDTSADKLSSRTIPCVFLGFLPDAPGWQFYHPTSRRVLPLRTSRPPPVDPLPPQGPAPSSVSKEDPLPGTVPVEVAVDSGAARGAACLGAASGGSEPARVEPGGAEPEGAEPRGAESEGAESGGAEPGGAELGGTEPEGAEPGGAESEGAESGGAEPTGTASAGGPTGASPRLSPRREPLSPQQLHKWFSQRTRLRSGAAGAGGSAAGGTGARGAGATSLGGVGVIARAGGTRGAGAAGPGGSHTRGTGAAGAGGVGGARAGDPGAEDSRAGGAGAGAAGAGDPGAGGTGAGGAGAGGAGGAGAGGTGAGGAGAGGAGTGGPGAGGAGTGGAGAGSTGAESTVQRRPFFVPPQPSSLPPPDSVLCQVLNSPLPAPSPDAEQTDSLSERHEPASRPASPVRAVYSGRRVPRPRPPPVPGTHVMALRPSFVPLQVLLPFSPASSLPGVYDPESDLALAKLVDFAAACRLDYTSLVAESESDCPPSVGGECALDTDVLEDRQEDFECLAAAVPHLVAMLLALEGDPDAPDIPTPRSYAETITGPYSSQWVKRPPGSPPAFKARYVARGFSQRQEVDFFQTFSPTPKMTTLRVLLHVAAERDYELHSLHFSTAFLQGSLHEEIWLHRPPGFTGTTLAALGFAPSTADPLLFLRTDTSLPPFYVLVYVLQRFGFRYSSPLSTPLPTGHSLSAPPLDESVEPSGPYPELVGCLITLGMGLVLGGRGPVVLTGHADASWVDDLATQWSSQGYTFSLGSGSVSWRSTQSSSVLSSNCEAEIYAKAMAA